VFDWLPRHNLTFQPVLILNLVYDALALQDYLLVLAYQRTCELFVRGEYITVLSAKNIVFARAAFNHTPLCHGAGFP
jgi:hypothetical protein